MATLKDKLNDGGWTVFDFLSFDNSENFEKRLEDIQNNCYPDETKEDIINAMNFVGEEVNNDEGLGMQAFFGGIKYAEEKFMKLLKQKFDSLGNQKSREYLLGKKVILTEILEEFRRK